MEGYNIDKRPVTLVYRPLNTICIAPEQRKFGGGAPGDFTLVEVFRFLNGPDSNSGLGIDVIAG